LLFHFLPFPLSPVTFFSLIISFISLLYSSILVDPTVDIGPDSRDAVFSLANVNLSSLVFVDGTCAGLSVEVVLNLANSVLGAVVDPLLGTSPIVLPADIDVCVATINSNFYDGVKAGGHLVLPGLNLQACLNLVLPVLSANANVQVALLSPLSRSVGVNLDVQLNGLVNLDANVAIGNGQRYHSWGLDLAADLQLKAGLSGLLTDLKVVVPATGLVGQLLNGVLSTVSYVADDVLCLVNYLLNFAPISATGLDLQAVIYMLVNDISDVSQLLSQLAVDSPLRGCNTALVQAIFNNVQANGKGFVPAPGQILGVVAKVNIAGIDLRLLLEVNVPSIDLSVKTSLCPATH